MAEDAGVPAARATRLPLRLAFEEGAKSPAPLADNKQARAWNPRNILSVSRWSPETILLKTNVNSHCAKSQMSIFRILTDNSSMYPNMYQVMYISREKLYIPTFVFSKNFGIGIIFLGGRSSLDEISRAQK